MVSRALLFVGLSRLTSRVIADIPKPPFSRLRPYDEPLALLDRGAQDAGARG